MIPFIRSPYNYDADTASGETGLVCSDPSLAQQQFRDESDINYILRQFNITGQLPPTVQIPQYGDFTEVTDYHSALNLVQKADEAFMGLPAHIRARFDNDPGALLDFVHNEANRAEAEKLGITNLPPADKGGPAKAGDAVPGVSVSEGGAQPL